MESKIREVTISARYIPILAEFMGQRDIRYYLNGILVEPNLNGGINLIATNGHALAVIHDKDGSTNDTWTCALPPKIVRACGLKGRKNNPFSSAKVLKFIGNAGHVMGAEDADASVISILHLETAYCEIIEPPKPLNWRKVIPTELNPCDRIGINASLLAKVQKAATIGGRSVFSDTSPINIYINDENSAFVIRPDALPEMVVIVMPMRCDLKTPALPDWLIQEIAKPEPELEKIAA